MNKLELIGMLKNEHRLSMKEAALLLIYFSKVCLKLLQGVTELKFGDYALSMLKNTSPTKAEIPKPAKAFK